MVILRKLCAAVSPDPPNLHPMRSHGILSHFLVQPQRLEKGGGEEGHIHVSVM